MRMPEIGEIVMLYPAPLPGVEVKPGKPLPLRRVQDGASNYRRFFPDEGAKRPFDSFLHDRVLRGDLLLSDPRMAYAHAEFAVAATPPAAPVAVAPAASSIKPEP